MKTCTFFPQDAVHGAVSAAAALALTFVSSQATALSDVDFDILNRTNQSIVKMWTAPASSGYWGYSVRNAFVPSGGSIRVLFDVGSDVSKTCRYDLKVLFDGGIEKYWRNLNLCAVQGISVTVIGSEVTGITY